MKLMTEIQLRRSKVQLSGDSRIMTLGSCFSDNMAGHLRDAGFTMLANPFGTLYNPESIASAIERLDSGRPFTESDCAESQEDAGGIPRPRQQLPRTEPHLLERLRPRDRDIRHGARMAEERAHGVQLPQTPLS